MDSEEEIQRFDDLISLKETTNDNNLREYPKDSFDRFGDDLCELIVSYLSIECKLRFECISKQWNRLLANRQKKLIIVKDIDITSKDFENLNDLIEISSEISVDWIRRVLKKFRFITDLDISHIDTEVLNEVIDNCHQLKSFRLRFDSFFAFDYISKTNPLIKTFEKFSEKFGQTLKVFGFIDNCDFDKTLMTDEIIIILSKLQKLTTIRIKGCENSSKITDSSVQTLIKNCGKLNKISISYELKDMKTIEVLIERANSNPKVKYEFKFCVDLIDEYKQKEKTLKVPNNLKILSIEDFLYSSDGSELYDYSDIDDDFDNWYYNDSDYNPYFDYLFNS